MESQLHLIWNPVAGNGAAKDAYQLVTDALAERGIPFTSEKSEYAGHATELANVPRRNQPFTTKRLACSS